VEETLIETKVVDSNLAEPIIEREDVSEYREMPWKEEVSHETMRQVSETIVSEETRKISTSSSSSSSDDDQAGVRSKEIRHHYEEETNEITEQVQIVYVIQEIIRLQKIQLVLTYNILFFSELCILFLFQSIGYRGI
jgi:hypothetical protein